MLNYTGHPIFDVGVAAVAAYVGKSDPDLITWSDLEKIAAFIEREYVKEPLKSFLGVAFTTNAWFNQPAFEKQPEKRRDYAKRILRNFDKGLPGERCVFTGEYCSATAFSEKLPPGRAFRQHIPLLTGEGVINFHPWGDAGLPISGKAALCLQAFPLGCAKCGGRLLAVHSDNSDLIYDFAAGFLDYNRQAMVLAQHAGSKKMAEAKSSAKTLLIETLIQIEQRRRDESEEQRPSSVTAYHLTNSGQSNPLDERNPPLEIYHLPFELTEFLFLLVSPGYRNEWKIIASRKQTLHYTDVNPPLVIFAVTRGGNNIFSYVVGANSRGLPELKTDAFKEALTVFENEILSDVYVGWMRGYLDDERAKIEDLAKTFDGRRVRVSHPREAFKALTDALKNSENVSWME